MARIGEGDPRWIVSERQDGQNVNSWHWTERDVTSVLREIVHESLQNQTIVENDSLKVSTKSISSFDGECTVYNRKGKVSYLLELKFVLSWEGQIIENGAAVVTSKGKVEVPEVEQDSNFEKLQVDVSCEDENPKLLDFMRTEGRKWVREQLKIIVTNMRETNQVNKGQTPASPENAAKAPTAAPAPAAKPAAAHPAAGTEFKMVLEWSAPPSELFATLTDSGRIGAYTRSAANFEPKVGGIFSLLNGSITGTVNQFEKDKLLGMRWRLNNWEDGLFSDVVMSFTSEERGTTLLTLSQINIPAGDAERTRIGWRVNFWEPIKMVFGFPFTWKEGERSIDE